MTFTGFQGLTKAQVELLDYWHRLCQGHRSVWPRKRDIDAGALRAHLANLSIMEIPHTGSARFRLAGSALCDAAGRNLKGCRLDALPDEMAELWGRGIDEGLGAQAPVGGLEKSAMKHGHHAWLRMPIEDEVCPGQLFLCHDEVISSSRDRETSAASSLILGLNSSIAA